MTDSKIVKQHLASKEKSPRAQKNSTCNFANLSAFGQLWLNELQSFAKLWSRSQVVAEDPEIKQGNHQIIVAGHLNHLS
eukprot:1149413-Pelagomonas_calceolata.AAC.4